MEKQNKGAGQGKEAVSEELKKKYWEMIRKTRCYGRISPGVIQRMEKRWEAFDADIVEGALRIHMARHRREREEYTLEIMRDLRDCRYGRKEWIRCRE